MTTLVIDLTLSQPVSTTVQAPLPTSTTTVTAITTTSLPPPPPQPQQSTTDPILVRLIGELEQRMTDLLQDNLALGKGWTDMEHGYTTWRISIFPTRDMPTVDMKEILHQRMFEDDSYKANNVHKDLYEALQKSLELDYSNQRLADQEEACASGAPRTLGASGSSQLPPPPPPSTGTPGSTPQQGREALSSSKTTASAQQSMAWTTSDTRYESIGIAGAQELSPSDDLMHDDSAPDEQERPATPEPAWTILPSNVSEVENNWASVLASSYEPPAENSLLSKTCDMTTFLNWYCRQINKSKLTQADLEEQAYEVVKVDWVNSEGDQVRINVNRPLPLGGPPGHVTIQTEFFFNKDLEYLRFGNKGSMHVLSISKMKAAYYPNFGLELLVPKQMWIEDVCTYDISANYQTQLNLTKPGWDATRYEFKHDYTIIESPRSVIFPVNNNERKIMRFNKIYKFSDGTLTFILETLDYIVKEFKINQLNPGMNTRFWTEKDVTRSKEFITEIERRLKTRRIYWNLECFIGGRVRDIDYSFHQRTE
ncbi:hypothetical protein Tco_1143905 [Tanacetum coccineum]